MNSLHIEPPPKGWWLFLCIFFYLRKKNAMKYLFSLVIACLSFATATAQSFEGVVEYDVTFRSHIMEVPTDQLAPKFGTHMKWFIKDGKYRKEYNGKTHSIEIFTNTSATLEVYNPEAKHWNQIPTMYSEVEIQEVEIVEDSEMILEKMCNEIILTTSSGVCRYFYPKDMKLNPNSFSGHMMGCWFEYLNLVGSMPLKMVLTSTEKTMEAKAVAITPQVLKDELFVKPN